MWAAIGGILGGFAAVLSAIVGWKAIQAKRSADRRLDEVESIKLSISSLQAALLRSDQERINLGNELHDAKHEIEVLSSHVRALEAKLRRYEGSIT